MILNYTLRWSRKNVFIIISSESGRVIWKKSTGYFGFKCWGKRSPDAIKTLIADSWEFLEEIEGNVQLFIKFIHIPYRLRIFVSKEILHKIRLSGILILGFKFIEKIPYNGCGE